MSSPTNPRPLLGTSVRLDGNDPAASYGAWLMRCLGARPARSEADFVVQSYSDGTGDWERSGAMALTGRADGCALTPPGQPATAVRGALLALASLAPSVSTLPGVELIGERAALNGLTRQAPLSAGGSCRILRAADGWWALSLTRADDFTLVPALVERDLVLSDPWEAVASWGRTRPARAAAERAQLLGLAGAALPEAGRSDPQLDHRGQQSDAVSPYVVDERPLLPAEGAPTRSAPLRDGCPLIIDLSALWAGPLAAHLLGLLGARVIKVEPNSRPDGARRGNPEFFDLLNDGAESVCLDLRSDNGRDALIELIRAADVVIESARPRALLQLGIDAEKLVAEAPALTWVSITGYGRSGPWANRVGYGDDVAAGAGLIANDPGSLTGPVFCGDAIADPLAGVHASVAALASYRGGGSRLIDLAMRDVAIVAARLPSIAPGTSPPSPPRARRASRPARILGADTARVLAEFTTGYDRASA